MLNLQMLDVRYTIDTTQIFDDTSYFENLMIDLLDSDFFIRLNAAEKFLFASMAEFWKNYIAYLDFLDGNPEIIDYVNNETINHSRFIQDMINKYQIKKIIVYGGR